MILRLIRREVGRARGRVVLLALLLGLMGTLLGTGFIAVDSLFHTRDVWYERLHLADLDVRLTPAADSELPSPESLAAIPGVAAVARRFVTGGFVEQKDAPPFPVMLMYLEPGDTSPVNQVHVVEGRWLAKGKPREAVIDRAYAAAKGLRVGDHLVVDPYTFPVQLEIVGIGLSPEFLVPTGNPGVMFPTKGSLGVVYASREQLDETFVDRLYDELEFTYRPQVDREAVRQRIVQALKGLEIERNLPMKDHFGYQYLQEDLKGFYIFTPVVAAVLAVLAGIVVRITLGRLLAARRRELGSLLALGIPRGWVAAAFAGVVALPGVVGGVLALPGGAFLGRFLAVGYAAMIGLPPVEMVYPARWLALAGLVPPLVAVVAALWSLRPLFRLQPLEALRGSVGEVRFHHGRRWAAWLGRGGPGTRYAGRNLLRRAGLTAAAIALIGLAMAMPAALLTSVTSWKQWAAVAVDEIGYDALVTFKVPLDADAVAAMKDDPSLSETEPFLVGQATWGDGVDTRLVGLPADAKLQRMPPEAGTWFSGDDADEVLVNTHFAGVSIPPVGSTIRVRCGERARDLRVVGYAGGAQMHALYVPLGTARAMLDRPGKSLGLAIRAKDLAAARRHFVAQELVTGFQTRADVAAATKELLGAMDAIMNPLVAVSVALSALFLVTVLSVTLNEREAELATLEALGARRAFLARVLFTEIGLLSAGALFVAVPGWLVLAELLRVLMARAWFDAGLALTPVDLARVAVPAAVLLPAAALPGVLRLVRQEPAAALRSRAFG